MCCKMNNSIYMYVKPYPWCFISFAKHLWNRLVFDNPNYSTALVYPLSFDVTVELSYLFVIRRHAAVVFVFIVLTEADTEFDNSLMDAYLHLGFFSCFFLAKSVRNSKQIKSYSFGHNNKLPVAGRGCRLFRCRAYHYF